MKRYTKDIFSHLAVVVMSAALVGCGGPAPVDHPEPAVAAGKTDSFDESKDMCVVDVVEPAPAQGAWTSRCEETLVDVLTSEKISSTTGTVNVGLRCAEVSGIELMVVEDYIAHHDALDLFLNGYDWANDGDGIALAYEVDVHANGVHAHVEEPNEQASTLIYDSELNLVALFEYGEVDTLHSFCPSDGSAEVEGPSNACFHQMVHEMRPGEQATESAGTSTLEEAEDDYGVLTVAARRYTAEFGLEPTDELNFELSQWEAGASVTLWASDDAPTTYHVVDYYQGWRVLAETDADGHTLLCD